MLRRERACGDRPAVQREAVRDRPAPFELSMVERYAHPSRLSLCFVSRFVSFYVSFITFLCLLNFVLSAEGALLSCVFCPVFYRAISCVFMLFDNFMRDSLALMRGSTSTNNRI